MSKNMEIHRVQEILKQKHCITICAKDTEQQVKAIIWDHWWPAAVHCSPIIASILKMAVMYPAVWLPLHVSSTKVVFIYSR